MSASLPTTGHAEVGALHYGTIRSFLKYLRHRGYSVSHEEGSGWFSRTFYFKGDPIAIKAIQNLIEDVGGDD